MAEPTVVGLSPIYLDNAALKIDAKDYAAAATKIECLPTTSTATFQGMKRTSKYQSTSVDGWTLSIDFGQDFETADSFSNLLFDSEGEEVTVTFAPVDGGTEWEVDVQLVPGGIGGSVKTYAATSVSLGVLGTPRRVAAPVEGLTVTDPDDEDLY